MNKRASGISVVAVGLFFLCVLGCSVTRDSRPTHASGCAASAYQLSIAPLEGDERLVRGALTFFRKDGTEVTWTHPKVISLIGREVVSHYFLDRWDHGNPEEAAEYDELFEQKWPANLPFFGDPEGVAPKHAIFFRISLGRDQADCHDPNDQENSATQLLGLSTI